MNYENQIREMEKHMAEDAEEIKMLRGRIAELEHELNDLAALQSEPKRKRCPYCKRNAVDESGHCFECSMNVNAVNESKRIPRRPWALSKQYGMTFVLS